MEMKEKKPPNRVRLNAMNGALLEAPVWETHERGSNWAAVIGVDPCMPGGMSRRFLEKGRGVCLYLTEQIAVHDPIEFAGDYRTWAGTKRINRWYGVVTEIGPDNMTLTECGNGLEAILLSKELRERRRVEEGLAGQVREV